MGDIIGSVEEGKLADLVLWKPSFFGVKPELIVKGGMIAWSQMGDANASIPTPEPVISRPMFAGSGVAAAMASVVFVSKRCVTSGTAASYNLKKTVKAVSNTRNIGKRDMVLNDATPRITVDPETYQVMVDDEVIVSENVASSSLPMTQRYFMF